LMKGQGGETYEVDKFPSCVERGRPATATKPSWNMRLCSPFMRPNNLTK